MYPPLVLPSTPSHTHTHWLTPSASPSLTPYTLTLLQPLPHPSHTLIPPLSQPLPHTSHSPLYVCTSLIPHTLTLLHTLPQTLSHSLTPHTTSSPYVPLPQILSHSLTLTPSPSYALPSPLTPSPLTPSPSYIHPPQTLTPSHLTHSSQRSDHHLLRQLREADPLGGVSEGVWKNDRVHLPQRAQL